MATAKKSSEQFKNLLQIFKRVKDAPNLSIQLEKKDRISFAGRVVGRDTPDSPAPSSNKTDEKDPLIEWIKASKGNGIQQVLASLAINNDFVRANFINLHKCEELGQSIEAISQRKDMRR